MIPQLKTETPVPAPESTRHWSLATRIAFRFTFAYFILWAYPRAVGSLGNGIKYSHPLREMWHAIVPWVGVNVLHLTGSFAEVANGSGDQLYDYVLIFCIAVTAALVTVVWSAIDRKRESYDDLYQWLRVLVRLVLTLAMMSYGADKLWWAQFPAPRLTRLIEPYGQTQPADLLWTFMGMSRMYSFFGGVGEMLGAILLIIPRMVTLGALVVAALMSNVLMLNLSYDVPRKIYSLHLLAMCIFLILPDIRRMVSFFVLNGTARLTPPVPLFKDKLLNLGVTALFVLIAVNAFVNQAKFDHTASTASQARLPATIRGIWAVDSLRIDGIDRPPLATDSERWRRVVLDNPYEFDIQPMDGPIHRYLLRPDFARQQLVIYKPDSPTQLSTLSYHNPDAESMVLEGELNGQQISAYVRRVDLSDPVNFALLHRGFHWVTQYMHWANQFETWH